MIQENEPASETLDDVETKDDKQSQEKKDKKKGQQSYQPPKRTVLVRYGRIRLTGQFRHSERKLPSVYTKVVIQTDRGLEIGEIISPSAAHSGCSCTIPQPHLDSFVKRSGPDYPFLRTGRMVRLATVQDLNEHRHIEEQAIREGERFKELSKQQKLKLKLVDVEHLFGGDRIIYYFMAEGRVDFRQLVKQLAQEYSTRIEMRQVGARDEAKIVGDYDTCGLELCCKSFLKVLQPVSMRMAKLQRTSMDPAKISGRCGRLKCCLRYENYGYQELKKLLPKYGTEVDTEHGKGQVVDQLILTQLVKVKLHDNNRYIAVNVEELLYRADKPDWKPEKKKDIFPEIKEDNNAIAKQIEKMQQALGEETKTNDKKKRKRRRRKRSGQGKKDGQGDAQNQGSGGGQGQGKSKDNATKKKVSGQSKPTQSDGGNNTQGSAAQGEGGAPKKRRRRRRRRKSGGQEGGNNASGGNSGSNPGGGGPNKSE